MKRAWLDVGSNLGDRAANIRGALLLLDRDFGKLRMSSIFESAAVGPTAAPPFYNLSVELRTQLSGSLIRERLRSLESELGRVRTDDKYAPRLIDLDLVYLEGEPDAHPQMATEAFVLVPLCELVPGLVVPSLGVPLYQVLADVGIPPDLRRIGPVEQL